MPRDITTVDWRAEEQRGCLRKVRLDEPTARRQAKAARRKGKTVSPYPCPWHPGHWHLGHLPSFEALERLAAALRARREEMGHDTPDPLEEAPA